MAAPVGFSYLSTFLDADAQQVLLEQVRSLEFTRDRFRGVQLRRGYCQFGYAYVTTGRKLTPAPPLPGFLAALAERGRVLGLTGFNQCIVTVYPEQAGIGWHVDAPCFGECIMAVSLGAEARLQFRPEGEEPVSHELLAAPGSLYVMQGPARWSFQHQVVPVEAVRYSLTFRQVP